MGGGPNASWTDDLPPCTSTAAGIASNQIYRDDGARLENYRSRDRSFHCKIDDNTSIYGLFSGINGSAIAEFALQRMAAEIVLGQLNDKRNDEEVKDVLKQAFATVEKGYMDSIDNLLARKTMLQDQLPEGLNQYEISQGYEHILTELNSINTEIGVGASVVLALIYKSKLYVFNIGSNRALLCKSDNNNAIRVVQLTVDHNLNNMDEVNRLSQLGLDVEALRQTPLESTRCIGNYIGKGGYKECDYLSQATTEPVSSQPEIVGGFPIDDSFRFLLLMSSGMCKTLIDLYGTETNEVNKEMVHMTVDQFRNQSTISGVAQTVVNKVVQYHYDAFMQQVQDRSEDVYRTRDDVTFLVRNFNFPMPNAIQKNRSNSTTVRFDPIVKRHSGASINYSDSESNDTATNMSQYSTNSSIASTGRFLFTRSCPERNRENEKTRPYVSFDDYFKNVEIAKQQGLLPEGIDFD